jgi:hypothetical protein
MQTERIKSANLSENVALYPAASEIVLAVNLYPADCWAAL